MATQKKSGRKKQKITDKISGNLHDIYDEYKEKFLLLAATFVEEEARQMVHWIKELAQIRQKVRRLALVFFLIITGMVVFFNGIAEYLTTLLPGLDGGLAQLLVGAIVILSAFILSKF